MSATREVLAAPLPNEPTPNSAISTSASSTTTTTSPSSSSPSSNTVSPKMPPRISLNSNTLVAASSVTTVSLGSKESPIANGAKKKVVMPEVPQFGESAHLVPGGLLASRASSTLGDASPFPPAHVGANLKRSWDSVVGATNSDNRLPPIREETTTTTTGGESEMNGNEKNSLLDADAIGATNVAHEEEEEEENQYGSDDEMAELQSLGEAELRARCLSLMRAAREAASSASTPPSAGTSTAGKSASVLPSPRHQPKLSPSMFAVQTGGASKRLKLGRTASIATRDELNKLPTERTEDYVVRIQTMFRNQGQPAAKQYASSAQFANDLMELCARVGKLFAEEKRVLELRSPAYVFGDIHGNAEDLKFFADHVWPLGMPLTAGGFLFLGDYVDRGSHGLEVLAYLFSQKCQAPEKVFLIRGNHETRSVNGWEEYYGDGSFLAQCKNRFGEELGWGVWEECNRVFDCMPLAAIIDKQIFCVHGGIPRCDDAARDTRLEDIRSIPCPIDVRQPMPLPPGEKDASLELRSNRLAFSLLWSDPADTSQEATLERDTGFGNSVRGSGSVIFGQKAVEAFLRNFNLNYIMRAHEATVNGIAVCKSAKVLTVFSTSKDHGCGAGASCGCVLVDGKRIVAITRSLSSSSSSSSALSLLSGPFGTTSSTSTSDGNSNGSPSASSPLTTTTTTTSTTANNNNKHAPACSTNDDGDADSRDELNPVVLIENYPG